MTIFISIIFCKAETGINALQLQRENTCALHKAQLQTSPLHYLPLKPSKGKEILATGCILNDA